MIYKWNFSTPEEEGMDSKVLNDIDHYLKLKQYRLINSILIVKNEKIIFEHYYNKFNFATTNNIKSIWKSIISILIGILNDKKIIKSLDDPISRYIPNFDNNTHLYHKFISIKNLLTMTSGIYWNGGIHYHCPMLEQLFMSNSWFEYIEDIAMANYPGSKFIYKEWDVILLSALISKLTGNSAFEFCNEYLYRPLDIKSTTWALSKDNISYPIRKEGDSADLSARDLAKLGLLLLNQGTFNGVEILSKKYIDLATTPSKTCSEYGYLFWIHDKGFSCRGYGGQEVNVYPKENMVIVVQATPTLRSKQYPDVKEELLKGQGDR